MKKFDIKKIYADAEKKRAELEKKMGVKVKVAVLGVSEDVEPCVCFFKPAKTFTKLQVFDLMYQSPMRGAEILFEATIIREESDKRVFQQDNDEDEFYIGALNWCNKQFTIATSGVKKK